MKAYNLGKCCNCGNEDKVHHIYFLPKKAPVPGDGWGCDKCGLPADGAVAVICEDCNKIIESKRKDEPLISLIKNCCIGFPAENERFPVKDLVEDFEHNADFHNYDFQYSGNLTLLN